MDRYTKAFVVASLLWFAVAAALGVWMAAGGAPGEASFAHVHLNLLGFMAMMVFGVGYFIIPRFNARPLRWPSWVPLHFWQANVGLVGMVLTYAWGPQTPFVLFSVLSALGVGMFVVNLGATLLAPAPAESAAGAGSGAPATEEARMKTAPAPPPAAVTGETRVGDLLTRWPESADVLVQAGLAPLANPAHREKVKALPVTLEMACANHGLDLQEVLRRLNAAIGAGAAAVSQSPPIGPGDVIGEVLRRHPATEAVFRKYYGAACFSCPGQATETVRQSAMMHNAREEDLLRELNEAAGVRG